MYLYYKGFLKKCQPKVANSNEKKQKMTKEGKKVLSVLSDHHAHAHE